MLCQRSRAQPMNFSSFNMESKFSHFCCYFPLFKKNIAYSSILNLRFPNQMCLFSWRMHTKLGIVLYYHESVCNAEKLVHYLQCQGHSKGLYDQNMTMFTVSSKLLVHLQTSLVWQYSIIRLSVLRKNGIPAFKVKVTVKV